MQLLPLHQNVNGVASQLDVESIEACFDGALPDSSYAMIRAAAERHAVSPALTWLTSADPHASRCTWSYASLSRRITATANFFHALGVGAGDVVAFTLPNLPETHLTLWGGQAAGIVFPINPLLKPAAITELLAASEARVLVTLAPAAGEKAALATLLADLPALQHLVLVAPLGRALDLDALRPLLPAALGLHDFAAGLRGQPDDRLVSGRRIRPDDLSSYFCTGGTTGAPKIAMRTHRNEVANAWSLAQLLGDGIGPGRNLFCGLPLFHVNGVMVTGLLPFSRGAHVLLGTTQGFRGDGVIAGFWRLVERHRIHFFSAVPTVFAALQQEPVDGFDLRSLQYGLCGAAPLPVELLRGFEQRTGLKILEGYGLTEGTCVSSCNPPLGERRTGSIGLRLPLQAMKAVVLDESGAYVRDCAVDEVGTLVISGPNVCRGYKVEAHNRGLWVDCGDDRRWLNTGDLGRQDADGYFYLTGRRKELIIRGGHNIDPASIEGPLYRHPAVQGAAAIGRPDAHAGELPVAYVQLKPGARVSEAELLDFARAEIAERAAVPKAVRILPALPLTGVGKIFKPELKQRETADALAEALAEAGAPADAIEVVNHPQRGLCVTARLARSSAEAPAREALGRYPFPFELTWTC